MTHILRRDRQDSRLNINDRDKGRPNRSVQIDPPAELAQMERPPLKFSKQHLADDRNHVAPIQRYSRQVEYR